MLSSVRPARVAKTSARRDPPSTLKRGLMLVRAVADNRQGHVNRPRMLTYTVTFRSRYAPCRRSEPGKPCSGFRQRQVPADIGQRDDLMELADDYS